MINEETLEKAALEWFKELGYEIAYGPDISPEGTKLERDSYSQVLLLTRLRQALKRINPTLPEEAIEEAIHRLVNIAGPTLEETNRAFHLMLRDGVRVEVRKEGEEPTGEIVKLFDFDDLNNNDWLVVSQFTVVEGEYNRRPDIVIFINGIPIGLIELKNPADIKATLMKAYNKIQNYKREIPSIFYYNEIIIISDGNEAKSGSITSPWERFSPWKTIHGREPSEDMMQLEVAIKGIFNKNVCLELVRDFISFDFDGSKWIKKLAWYNQYDSVKIAVDKTLIAYKSKDKRIGITWHAQGAGKSLTMVFYVAKLLRIPELNNPTVLVLTDRNDLDNQIYEEFEAARDLIPFPKQAQTIENLKELLKVPAGGIIFSTVQKFKAEKGKFPLLSDRENIIVIADEAHRSHYNFVQGYARYIREALPKASFIGFTATPVELGDRSTLQVFGDYIHTYDLSQAERDKVIVPIIYENRWAKLGLENHAKEILDEKFEEITETEEVEVKEKLKGTWSRLERVLGSEDVLKKLAKDIVEHFEKRSEVMEGKAMVACISRRVCVDLYNYIIKLRPEWHDEDDKKGMIKILMTGSTDDPIEFQPHIRDKDRREEIKKRFVNPKDPLKIVIVRDMLLTGFDNPCLHTLYVIKPMKGHTLIQAITRVDRVWKDKPAGFIVDYIGIGEPLKLAIAQYTIRADISQAVIPEENVLPLLKEKYEEVKSFLKNIYYSNWRELNSSELMRLLQKIHNEIVKDDTTKRKFLKAVIALNKAFILAEAHPEAFKIRDEIAFFQVLKRRILKISTVPLIPSPHIESAIRDLVSESVIVEDIIDLLAEKGIKYPKLPILSEEFLKEVSEVEFSNLRIEILRKLLNDEIKVRMRSNLVRYRSFKERLEQTIKAYHIKAMESAKVMEELIKIAKELKESVEAGEKLGLTEEELAFYDALSQGKEFIMSDQELNKIVKELVNSIKKNLSIDWTEHENVKSKVRATVKRLLRKHGFSPIKYPSTVEMIMRQAQLLYKDWPIIHTMKEFQREFLINTTTQGTF
ncbi:MAG: type I restriction endonuclease subunit R [Candidatus Aenigmatarchaeota archaeon]